MLIYTAHITPRLRYIAEAIFGECTFTSSPVEFYEADVPKINYSYKRFGENEFHIVPHGLLEEITIKQQRITVFNWNGLKTFFAARGDIPFDIFSASFYLLTRYEEYLPHEKDGYARFAHTESIAFKESFLDKPLVNQWLQKLYQQLQQKFAGFKAPAHKFNFVPTYDIDIAFAGGRGLLRRIIRSIKKERTTINGKDVLDVYDWLDGLHRHHHLSPVYFFLLAKRRGRYDKNLSPKSKKLRQLIKQIATDHSTGIHPSWQSFHDDMVLKGEISSLQQIVQKKVIASRQHYIQFTLPYTYRQLIDAGITEEYSMGYGSINGFRASYASSFYWYDLVKEEQTSLLLHPFCYMEANSYFEQKLSVDEAAKELQYYYDSVKEVNGKLITIFHNHFLTEQKQWKPWRDMYEQFLMKTTPAGQPSIQFPIFN